MAIIALEAERATSYCQTRESYRLIKKLSGRKPFPMTIHRLRGKQGNFLEMIIIDERPPEINEIKGGIELFKNAKAITTYRYLDIIERSA